MYNIPTYDLDKLKTIISLIGPRSCPYDINFHCHTTYSDGSLSPSQVIHQATIYRIKHIAVTDHHSIKAIPEMHRWIENNSLKFQELPNIWSGIEISCLLKKCLVHVVGLGFDPSHNALKPYISGESPIGHFLFADNVARAIHEAGGLVILAHPGRYRLHHNELIEEAKRLDFDGGEAWYDYDYSTPWRVSEFICSAIHKNLKYHNLISTCGTDTHGRSILCR